MERGVLGQIVMLFGTLSLIAVGGANVLVPEIHRQVVVAMAWMNDATFARLLAIVQTAPGPNVMLASIIGWHVAGLAGLVAATFAILLPSSLIAFVCSRGLTRFSDRSVVKIMTVALVPVALGLMLASGMVAAVAAGAGLLGFAITAATLLATLRTSLNPLVSMLAGTLVYVAAWLLGFV
jgi:chromate transporter